MPAAMVLPAQKSRSNKNNAKKAAANRQQAFKRIYPLVSGTLPQFNLSIAYAELLIYFIKHVFHLPLVHSLRIHC